LHTTAEREVVRQIKEKSCYLALNVAKEEKELLTSAQTESYTLPDGKSIRVSDVNF
jgi:centractin